MLLDEWLIRVRARRARRCSKSNEREGEAATSVYRRPPRLSSSTTYGLLAMPLTIVLALVSQIFGCRREDSENNVKWKGHDSGFENDAARKHQK